jgi:ribonuclease-3
MQRIISYRFKDVELLKTALIHDSYLRSIEPESTETSEYERMEFLGDSVLGLIVAQYLFQKYPNQPEGFLSKLKSHIVCEKFLAVKAKDFHLPDNIILSDNEIKMGGRERKSTISDTVESLICAIYLDGGLQEAKKFVTTFIIKGHEKQLQSNEMINHKSILQEYCQAKYQKTPYYHLESESGPDHNKQFFMNVFINDEMCGTGTGQSKKEAQQKAASDACENLCITKNNKLNTDSDSQS